MAKQSTKSGTGKGRRKVTLQDLPKSERELSSKDIRKVRGGITPIKGESKDKDHRDEISLSS